MSPVRIIRNTNSPSAPRKIRIVRPRYWSVHTHSKFSAKDALPTVQEVVKRAKELGYRGLGLTDHGNMAGSVQLYQECKKAGIKPFPGTEFYLVKDRKDLKAKRYHTCIVAYTTEGYRNLIRLNTLSHQNFRFKPLLDLADLAAAADAGHTAGLAITTGCYFGLVTQTLLQDGYDAAKRIVAAYATWFPGSTYVEVQCHNVADNNELMVNMSLELIADELGLKMIVSQDSHYTHPEHQRLHDNYKRMVSFGPDPDDAVFPGDGYHMVDEAWMRAHHDPRVMNKALAGLDDLLAKHTLTIPELDEYNYLVPEVVADPVSALRERCVQALRDRGLWAKAAYRERLEHEMEIIEVSRMAGYLMLVAMVTDYCTQQKIFFQARGSASGSMLCWLLGITSVDPLKWNLLMERFLSKDRTKPPDIDLDIEHTRRKELMDWLAERFSVAQIGTWAEMSLSGDEDGKGSLRVQYLSAARKQGKPTTWEEISEEDKKQLYELSDLGLYYGYGTHAAGLLVTSTKAEMDAMVPMMTIPNKKGEDRRLVSQYDMHDVEALGLVKLDVLGLKTMSVLKQTILNLGRDPADGLDFIPLSDSKTFTRISRGDTDGVFQLEGGTAARGMRELRPTKVSDVIASMALYRPATMKSGATEAYVRRKHKDEPVPARHEIINRHTKDTYGILLYQEQVIAVLRDLGMDPDHLTKFLKAVKASNDNVAEAAQTIAGLMDEVRGLCEAAGMTDADIAWLGEALKAYADYGFNAAHSVVYGLTAYRCAWLITNAPVEFHAALLAVAAGTDKEEQYIATTRRREIRVLKADVNYSGVTYQVDPKGRGVRKGLLGVKHVGLNASPEIVAHQPYTSLEHFLTSVNPSKVTGVKPLLEEVAKSRRAWERWEKKRAKAEERGQEPPPEPDPVPTYEGLLAAGEGVGVVAALYESGALDSILEGSR